MAAAIAVGSASAGEVVETKPIATQSTSTLALALGPKLQPFDSDEITVYSQRLATIAPATATQRVNLAPDQAPEVFFTVRPLQTFRLSAPVSRALANDDLSDARGLDGEFAVATGSSQTGIDIGFAQRTSLRADERGERLSRGAEVRIGQRLRGLVGEFQQPTWDKPAWYFFAASDGQALTWTPARTDGARQLHVQDRVTIGDLQAGVSIQASGVQASLTYLEREVSNAQRSDKQSFTGIALTWRR